MTFKKDENYYKKLYRKTKDSHSGELNRLLEVISFYKNFFTVLCKKSENGEIMISSEDVMKIKETDKLNHSIDKKNNITFKIIDSSV